MEHKRKQSALNDVQWIDYKYVRLLRPYLDRFGRIKSKYYTGNTLRTQKKLATAVKRARIMGMLPFVK